MNNPAEGAKLQGTVKWFSHEKGYGFITSDSGEDYYFNVQSINGAALPANGDSVRFETTQGKKGPRAAKIDITTKAAESTNGRADDRIICQSCGKKIVPRIITNYGEPEKSVCPYCAATIREFKKIPCPGCKKQIIPAQLYLDQIFSKLLWAENYKKKYICPHCSTPIEGYEREGCFIATAVYGDSECRQVLALRKFRDNHLQHNMFGRIFIDVYYATSPHVAAHLTKKPFLATQVKKLLDILVRHLKP